MNHAEANLALPATASGSAPPVPDLSVVVPCFNEADGIQAFFDRLLPALKQANVSYEIVCVNDGSTDDTLARLLQIKQRLDDMVVIDLVRNFTKEAALSAGLAHSRGRAVLPIDADLQDPPEIIPEMVALWRNGAEVVLAQRVDRSSDSLTKRWSANLFYRIHNAMANVQLPTNVGDFRLMDRVVVDVVNALPERQRFMKGLLSWPGYKTATVSYVREVRNSGHSAWTYWRLWNLALDGITGFTTLPLRLWFYVGIVVFLGAMGLMIRTIFNVYYYGVDVPGYASMTVIMLLLGGLQMIGIGILGEYIGRIQNEVKGRPIYLVRKIF